MVISLFIKCLVQCLACSKIAASINYYCHFFMALLVPCVYSCSFFYLELFLLTLLSIWNPTPCLISRSDATFLKFPHHEFSFFISIVFLSLTVLCQCLCTWFISSWVLSSLKACTVSLTFLGISFGTCDSCLIFVEFVNELWFYLTVLTKCLT